MNNHDYERGPGATPTRVNQPSGAALARLPGAIPFGDTLLNALRQWQSDFAPRHYPQVETAKVRRQLTPGERRAARRMDWDSQLP